MDSVDDEGNLTLGPISVVTIITTCTIHVKQIRIGLGMMLNSVSTENSILDQTDSNAVMYMFEFLKHSGFPNS